MKRLTKLLALFGVIFALSLAFCLVAFADGGEIAYHNGADFTFDNLTSIGVSDTASYVRYGKYELISADGGKYLLMTSAAADKSVYPNAETTNNFFSEESMQTITASGAPYSIKDYDAVLNMDIMTPTGTFTPMTFNPWLWDSNGKYQTNYSVKITAAGKVDGRVSLSTEKNVWQHLTVVLSYADVNGTAKINAYYYLNGEYCGAYTVQTVTLADTVENIGFRRIRMYTNAQTTNNNEKTAVDNVAFSFVARNQGASYGDIANHTKHEQPVAKIGDTCYYDMSAALSAAVAGDRVTLLVRPTSHDALTLDKPLYIDCTALGTAFDLTSVIKVGTDYIFDEVEDGVYHVHDPLYKTVLVRDFENYTAGATPFTHPDGRGKIEVQEADNTNKYVNFSYKSGSMIDSGTTDEEGNPILTEKTNNAIIWMEHNTYSAQTGYKYNLEAFPYASVDFDVMTPSGEYAAGATLFAFLYANTGKQTFVGNTHGNLGFEENGTFSAAKLSTVPYTWQHITVVYDFTRVTVDATFTQVLYMNGAFVESRVYALSSTAAIGMDPADLGIQHFRLNAATNTPSEENANKYTSLDNVKINLYKSSYGNYSEMAATVYGEDYKFPYGDTEASVGGAIYDNVNDAILAAGGATVKLEKDIAEYDGVNITAPVVIDTQGYAFEYEYGELVRNTVGNTVSFSLPTADDYVTVEWYDHGNNLIFTEHTIRNKPLTPPEYTHYLEYNGWYCIGYSGADWAEEFNGEARELVATGNLSLYPTHIRPIAYLGEASYNLDLKSNMLINLYLPTEIPDSVSGITVTADGVIITSGETVVSGGKELSKYSLAAQSPVSLADTIDTEISYTVLYNGTEYSLTQKLSPSTLKYSAAVLKSSAYSSAHGLVLNMLRYASSLSLAAYGNEIPECSALLTEYSASLPSIDGISVGESRADYGELVGILDSIRFSLAQSEPAYRVSFVPGSRVSAVSFSVYGYAVSGAGNADIASCTYSSRVISRDSESYILTVDSSGIPIHNVNRPLTLTVRYYDGDGIEQTATGVYDIAAYYNGIKEDESFNAESVENYKAFVINMCAYSASAIDYRFPSGAVDDGYVTYEEFGAVGDGVTDDFYAIVATHAYANANGLTVRATPGNTYYIGKNELKKSAIVKTNTVWTGANFIIDDSNISADDESSSADTVLFQFNQDISATYAAPGTKTATARALAALNENGGIKRDTVKRIDLGLGYPAMVRFENEENMQYIRYGDNENSGNSQREMVILDENGYVDESTPFIFDFTKVTRITIYRIDTAPITLEGGTITTIANQDVPSYKYFSRNIQISRSNVTVRNLTHKIVGEGENGNPYSSFLGVSQANNVLIEDCMMQSHKTYYAIGSGGGRVGMGSYDLGANNALNVTWRRVRQSNFLSDYNDLLPTIYATPGYWGIMGSNFCKNLTYDECRLTRYDAHCGVYNATITNSEVGHIALIGGGVARIENSTVYVGTASYPVVNLRSDYGSTWEGDMVFKNVHVVISNPNIKTFTMIGGSHVSHYFGYQTYLPENIEIDNITCNNAGATVKVFSDTLCGYTDAQRNDKTNPYITTKTVVIRNNHANLTYSYPDAGHTFFSDLQVTEE